ncbi:MAG: TonB family protein [Elusimicrobiota bacterium]|jgi:TonB family protein
MEARVPVSVTASLALHVGIFGGYFLLTSQAEKVQYKVISNVDFLVSTPKPQTPLDIPKPPPSMKDFLKLALPTAPRTPLSAPLEVKAPEIQRKLMELNSPKLDERSRAQKAAALDALDLSKRRESLAKIDAAPLTRESRPALEMPKLEEVGVRQASRKTLEMAALEEARKPQFQALAALPSDLASRRSAPATAGPLLAPEAANPRRPSAFDRIAQALPQAPPPLMAPSAAPTLRPRLTPDAPAPLARREAGPQAAAKKAVEIEGPLSNRQVLSAAVPQFPSWAKDRGILEADVAIRFYVDPAGSVLGDMRVERTSGFGRLDRLAMDSLKNWRFMPVPASAGNQWGVITFRFILE